MLITGFYLSSDHPFQVYYKVRRLILSQSAMVCYYKVRQFYYKVRQNMDVAIEPWKGWANVFTFWCYACAKNHPKNIMVIVPRFVWYLPHNYTIHREYFMESAGVRYLRTSCWRIRNRTSERSERVRFLIQKQWVRKYRLRFFSVSLYLRFDFRVCNFFFLFVILAGPHLCDVAFSDYSIFLRLTW